LALTARGPQAPLTETKKNQPKAVIGIEDAESKLATNAPQSDSGRGGKARISAGYSGVDFCGEKPAKAAIVSVLLF
jgi:hypothetical protein